MVLKLTLLDALAKLGEVTTIHLLKVGTLKLAGNFKGRESEVVASLDMGDWR